LASIRWPDRLERDWTKQPCSTHTQPYPCTNAGAIRDCILKNHCPVMRIFDLAGTHIGMEDRGSTFVFRSNIPKDSYIANQDYSQVSTATRPMVNTNWSARLQSRHGRKPALFQLSSPSKGHGQAFVLGSSGEECFSEHHTGA
jgi:hypothetical protein